jgi:hypothetical protein
MKTPTMTSSHDGFGPCERVGNNPSTNNAMPASMASSPSKAKIVLETGDILITSNAQDHRPLLETNAGCESSAQITCDSRNCSAGQRFGASACSGLSLGSVYKNLIGPFNNYNAIPRLQPASINSVNIEIAVFDLKPV